VGFLSGVRHYYAARHREVVMPMRATDSGGA
jgi:hypothetical protein